MQSHRNPTRRNRNIGTAKQGHGQSNSMVIPSRNDGPYWLDCIGEHKTEIRIIADKEVQFIIEVNNKNFIHPCTVDDVARVLEALPKNEWLGLQTFVFRQPSRKQTLVSPVWGRLLYRADLETAKGKRLAKGPVIFLDAVQIEKPIIWSASLDTDDSKELESLRADGHDVQRSGRKYVIMLTASSARNTQLYRTLLHEIGHWFDWLSKVEIPSDNGGDWECLEKNYFARPKAERESFAHRYADAKRIHLEQNGLIPFDRLDK